MDIEAHREMCSIFVREIAALVPRVSAQLDLLREDPTHAGATEELRLFFHRIAGTAASVDLADLGRVAGICERVVTLAQRGDQDLLPHLHAILLDGKKVVASLLEKAMPEKT